MILEELKISDEGLSGLVKNILLKGKRENEVLVEVYRHVFVKWMCKRGKWNEYKLYLEKNQRKLLRTWEKVYRPEDFLGETSFVFYNIYEDWFKFVVRTRCKLKAYIEETQKKLYASGVLFISPRRKMRKKPRMAM